MFFKQHRLALRNMQSKNLKIVTHSVYTEIKSIYSQLQDLIRMKYIFQHKLNSFA